MENKDSGVEVVRGASEPGFKIKDHTPYLEVVFDGVLLKHIMLSSIGELMKHTGFQRIPVLWNPARAGRYLVP